MAKTSGPPRMASTSRRSYAGVGRRFAAYLLDNALVYMDMGLSLFVLGLMFAPPAVGWQWLWTHDMIMAPLVPWLYWAIMESSPYQATIRYWSKVLSALLLIAGFMMIGFTSRKEGLHDIIAGTLVVKR